MLRALVITLLISLIFSALPALAEQRFPPPDFESGHKLPVTTTPAARAWLLQYLDVAVLGAGLGMASWLALRKRSRRGVVALSVFSLLYFGFWRKGCVCSIGSLQNIALALCDRSYVLPWAVTAFFVLPLAFALFAGRSFCAGVCPHGALQDLVLVKPVKVPPWLEESLSVLPYVYLGAGVLFAATGSSFILCQYDPFVPIFRMSGTSVMVLAGVGLLLLGMFVGRPYCRFLCPYGALLKLGSLASKGRVRVTPDHCTQCRLCEASCPFGALREPANGGASRLPTERRLLTWLLALLPALIAAGVWLGGHFSGPASRLHPTVSLAQELVRDQGAQPKSGILSAEDLALGRARQMPKEILAAAAVIEHQFGIGGRIFGGWVGLVVGAKLISLARRRRRTDYEPNRGACLSCARCFEYCPSELVRRGLLPSAEVGFGVPPLGAPAFEIVRASESRAPNRLRAGVQTGYDTWRLIAWISAIFTAVVGLVLLVDNLGTSWDERLNSPQMQEHKEKLRLNPTDESVRKQIRELDLQLRQGFFRHLSQTGSGKYLLLGAAIVFIFAAGQMAGLRKELPMPKPKPDATGQARRAATAARWSVAAAGAAVVVILFALSLVRTTALPTRPDELEKLLSPSVAAALGSDGASLEELQRNWPRFRGANGGGVSLFTNLPLSWDVNSGVGIGWKSPAQASGFNSPIVWEDRVFFSGGDTSERHVFCLDVNSGRLLWREEVKSAPGAATGAVEIPESSGYAAATMATDGRRLFVIFANGDLAALTLEGRPVWSKCLGALKNSFGHASSLAVWRDRLIVQVDQGESDQGKSRLYALEGRTGEIVWQRQRQVGSSWATPIVIEPAGKAQIITLAVPWVISYAAADGTELWRVSALNGEITPSPIFAGGLLFVVSPGEKLLAIRPDGQGDVTKTHIVWTAEENVPDITSPLSNGELIFTLMTSGRLTCFDAQTGQKQWEHDYNSEFYASPGLAGDRLYLFGQNGLAVEVEAARQFKEIFRTEMGDVFCASPAFAQNRLFMRGATNIWCVGP